jgi:hypothetical protein
MDMSIVISICGGGFEYSFVPADGTRGGIMVAWRALAWSMSQEHASAHKLSLKLKHQLVSESWWITAIYGLQGKQEKLMFLQELRTIRASHAGSWMVCGDFNLIYRAEDKNNLRLNRRLMGAFRSFLDELELAELHLQGRLYTWSNEQSHPTLSRIDRAFVCAR